MRIEGVKGRAGKERDWTYMNEVLTNHILNLRGFFLLYLYC